MSEMKPADPLRQRLAMTRKLERLVSCEGVITLPAVPRMSQDYLTRCEQIFAAVGRTFDLAEREQLLKNLEQQLQRSLLWVP